MQPSRQGDFFPEVSGQFYGSNPRVFVREVNEVVGRIVYAAVVDEQHFEIVRDFLEHLVQGLIHRPGIFSLVIHRNDD